MNDPSKTSHQPMLPDLGSDTSSAASAAGPTPYDSPESPTTPMFGLAHVRVSHSRARARGAERATLDIFGQHGSHSSRSVALQSSLENRLRAETDLDGSMLYSLTWNDAVTPSGRRICALRNSLRTGGVGCSSWATPTVTQAGGTPEQFLERKRRTRACGVVLTDLALQARTWIPGVSASGSTASTASVASSQLNPRFSLWLMGYPIAWASCGEAVMRSSRKSQPRSSERRRKRGSDE
jgi:hypothetical protein